jgi:hypothetical protein
VLLEKNKSDVFLDQKEKNPENFAFPFEIKKSVSFKN